MTVGHILVLMWHSSVRECFRSFLSLTRPSLVRSTMQASSAVSALRRDVLLSCFDRPCSFPPGVPLRARLPHLCAHLTAVALCRRRPLLRARPRSQAVRTRVHDCIARRPPHAQPPDLRHSFAQGNPASTSAPAAPTTFRRPTGPRTAWNALPQRVTVTSAARTTALSSKMHCGSTGSQHARQRDRLQ